MPDSSLKRILVYGPHADEYSLAKVNRSLAIALAAEVKARNLPYEVTLSADPQEISRQVTSKDIENYPELAQLAKPWQSDQEFDFLIFNSFPRDPSALYGLARFHAKIKIMYLAWEEDRYPERWVKEMNENLQLVFAASEHTRAVLKHSGVKVPITIVPNALMPSAEMGSNVRGLFQSTKKYRFLHVSSGMERKAPQELVNAYLTTFTGADDVVLLIKSFPNANNQFPVIFSDYQQRKQAENLAEIELLDNADLTDGELQSLYQTADAYLSPSKAEGFNIPVLEAMSQGVPVVTTAWSGQMDFVNDLNAYLIDYELVPARSHLDNPGAYWAQPSLQDLQAKLRQVYSEKGTEAQNLKIKLAKQTAAEYSWDRSARMVLEQLAAVGNWSKKLAETKLGVISTYNTICGIAEYSSYLYPPVETQLNSLEFIANFDAVGRIAVDAPNIKRFWEYGELDFAKLFAELDKEIQVQGKLPYDLVHIQYNLSFYTFPALEILINGLVERKIPTILTPHAIRTPGAELGNIRQALEKLTKIIVLNSTDLAYLENLGLKNVVFLPHGNASVPYQSQQRLLTKLGLKKSARGPIIATHGFLVPNKGVLETLQAVKLLQQDYPEITYLAINSVNPKNLSSQSLSEEFDQLIKELELTQNVIHISQFLDKAEILTLLAAADLAVFAYPEAKETASGAIRLAIAANTPFVLTPSSQLADLQAIGSQINDNQPATIAAGVKHLLGDPQELQQLKLRIQAYSRENDWDQIAVRYLAELSKSL